MDWSSTNIKILNVKQYKKKDIDDGKKALGRLLAIPFKKNGEHERNLVNVLIIREVRLGWKTWFIWRSILWVGAAGQLLSPSQCL